jgi:hypothetical protein
MLFVADWSTNCIVQYDLSTAGTGRFLLPLRSITSSEMSPRSLSVSSAGRLLVTSPPHELILFGADGTELKRVVLPSHVNPQHALETARGTFVVCHTGLLHDQVTEVDDEGQVLRSFGSGRRGCGPDQLNEPQHLAIDSISGRIFVADSKNHRVLILNWRLELERVLLMREDDGIVWPHRLCYLERSGRLVVVESTRCVKVFSVR